MHAGARAKAGGHLSDCTWAPRLYLRVDVQWEVEHLLTVRVSS